MPIDQIVIYILFGIILFLTIWVTLLEIKFRKLPSVKSDQIVDDRLTNLEKNTSELNSFKKQTELNISVINGEIRETIQGIETVRFNPFKGDGIGGDQSFATALIDKNGNGVIISSLYSLYSSEHLENAANNIHKLFQVRHSHQPMHPKF